MDQGPLQSHCRRLVFLLDFQQRWKTLGVGRLSDLCMRGNASADAGAELAQISSCHS
eukprot:m.134835 g.134835  ORF g.134835 m.134835 type:complete len:57 (+) comp15982_c0_seq4:2190-2360(+)